MPVATFRFYEELNDFLPPLRRKQDFEAVFKGRESVKDMIEGLGVPHTEVDLILVNGVSVDFGYILQDRDRVSVYPVFECLDIRNVTHLREIPLRETRFIADVNIGDFVRCMRALGLDVYCDSTLSAGDIIRISIEEKRTILTKSRNLLKHRDVARGIYLRPGTTVQQIRRIIDFLSLRGIVVPFSRCLVCNSPLVKVTKESAWERIPPKARTFYDDYSSCSACGRIYWQGSHFTRIKKVVDEVLA
jgi:uncharacterized protein with PIN domain